MVWLGGVELSLMEFSKQIFFLKFFFCGGGSALPASEKFLLPRMDKKLVIFKISTVSFLQPGDVVKGFDRTRELRTPQDVTPMGLANLALEIAGEEKVMANILRRVLQGMQR